MPDNPFLWQTTTNNTCKSATSRYSVGEKNHREDEIAHYETPQTDERGVFDARPHYSTERSYRNS